MRNKQRYQFICRVCFISSNKELWSLVGKLSVPKDVLICNNVGVVTGYVHFLSFIWVDKDGLGRLSKAQSTCGNKNTVLAPILKQRWIEESFRFSQGQTDPHLYYPNIHRHIQFTSCCVSRQYFKNIYSEESQENIYRSGRSNMSVPCLWLSNPEHLYCPKTPFT